MIDQTLINQQWLTHLRNETKKPKLTPHTYDVDVILAKENPGFSFMDSHRPLFYNELYAKKHNLTKTECIEALRGGWLHKIFGSLNDHDKASFAELNVNEGALLVTKEKHVKMEDYRKKSYVYVKVDGEEKLYFITAMKIVDDENIHYSLILDAISTYFHKIKIDGQAKVLRKHFDRWKPDTSNPAHFIPNFDFDSGIWKRESDIQMKNFITNTTFPVDVETKDISDEVETLQWDKSGRQPYYVLASLKQNNKEHTFDSTKDDSAWISSVPWITAPVWPSINDIDNYNHKNVFYKANGTLTTPPAGVIEAQIANTLTTLNQYGSSVMYGAFVTRLPLYKRAIYTASSHSAGGSDTASKGFNLKTVKNTYAKTDKAGTGANRSYVGYVLGTGTQKKEQTLWQGSLKSKPSMGDDYYTLHSNILVIGDMLNIEWYDTDGQIHTFVTSEKVKKYTAGHASREAEWKVNTTSQSGNNILFEFAREKGKSITLVRIVSKDHIVLKRIYREIEVPLTSGFGNYITGDDWRGEVSLYNLNYKTYGSFTHHDIDQVADKELETKLQTSQFKQLQLRNVTGDTFDVKREYIRDNPNIVYNFRQLVSPDKYKKMLTLVNGVYATKQGDNSSTFITDETLVIPTLSSSYNDYFQSHLSQYNTAKAGIDLSERQATTMGSLSLTGGALGMGASLATGGIANLTGSAVGMGQGISSLIFARQNANMARKKIKAQVEDLERTPSTINNNNVDTFVNLENQEHMWIGNTGIVAVVRDLPTISHDEVYNYLNRYGYEDGRNSDFLSYSDFQTRHKYSYWEVADINEAFDKDSLPPEVIEHINGLFTSGVTFWTIEDELGNVHVNDYRKENWELDMAHKLTKQVIWSGNAVNGDTITFKNEDKSKLMNIEIELSDGTTQNTNVMINAAGNYYDFWQGVVTLTRVGTTDDFKVFIVSTPPPWFPPGLTVKSITSLFYS